MLKLLDIESDDKKIVGIHGIGGIGKTTIARAVYNTVFHHFQGYSFIENIQENDKKHGLVHLLNQLIFDVLKLENRNITNVDVIKNVIQRRFCEKKVLIVLDDVDQNIQAETLVGNLKWFGIGSKIIITSRNKNILRAQHAEIYKPEVMNLEGSLQLFSHHAFRGDQPLVDYWELSKAMVKNTGGLPLALEVIGSSLYSKEKSVWYSMLKKLQKVPNNDVMKSLKISYDELNDEEQNMFLDTACFFIGMNKDIACSIWDGCGFSSQAGLDALCVRSMVTISEGVLRMHDQLRDLGREIVRQESIDEPGKRTRIWSQEEVFDVLESQTGTSRVRGLSIDFRGTTRSRCLMSEEFAAMTNLSLLQVDYAHFSENFIHSFSNLRWLSWKGCPEQYAQTNFFRRKLAVLDLSHSEITENWMGWNYVKMAENLKVVSLTSCDQLSRTPDLSANQNLEVLILKDSKNLVEMDTSIGNLKNLVKLDMSGCESLVDLPIEICRLSSLETLDLSECKSLKKLPEKLDSMISLASLDLSFCKQLEFLPNLPPSLKELCLKGCERVVDLPNENFQLTSLERLDLSRCKSLNEQTEQLNSMVSLASLDLSFCKQFESLPSLPNSLRVLCLKGCEKLLHISNLPSGLTSLDVWGCSSILYISGLPSSLTSLFVWECSSIRHISSTSGLRNLEKLSLNGCNRLQKIEGVDEGLDSLEFFTLAFCPKLRLPKLMGSKKLRKLTLQRNGVISKIEGKGMVSLEELEIYFFQSLRKLPNLSDLKQLRKLEIIDCPELANIEGLEYCESLETLKIEPCEKLTEIPGLDRLESLRELTINGCIAIERFPDLSNLKQLNVLAIEDCKNLTKINGVDRLEFLEKLNLSGCESLETLPDLSKIQKLNDLAVEDCKKLTEINGVDRLEILEKLNLSGCVSLERFPDLSNLQKLEQLRAKACKKPTGIHGVDRLKSLELLDISGCESLERLPDLSRLKMLNDLAIEGCKKLTEIHGVDKLEFLKNLDIGGCGSLEGLPNLSNLKNLKKLRANGCRKLTEIQAGNGLESLEFLDITGCISLEKIPDLTNLNNFWNVCAAGAQPNLLASIDYE
ncbi:hypothetical protein NE237_001138 [Protea cynaroides]|uniref:TMV resistance protein N-like n=1 Tax=Protea cynaroides TaxID=273540 RepID=A0A9Q0QY45_9MAGN|nr:hypothetical protein NE237_001138 [Protea cynaroides]